MKTATIQCLLICTFVLALCQAHAVAAEGNDFAVDTQPTVNAFPLVQNGESAKIVFDAAEAPVVKIAAEALNKDIVLVTGTSPGICLSGEELPKTAVVIGTIEKSRFIRELCEAKKIPAQRIQGKWETFLIAVVDRPFKSVDRALVIAGSDPHGAAYGSSSFPSGSASRPGIGGPTSNPKNAKTCSSPPEHWSMARRP